MSLCHCDVCASGDKLMRLHSKRIHPPQHHAPAPIVTAVALANGLKFTADAYGGLAVWTPANLVQFATRVSLRNDGSERITGLHVWDAWEEVQAQAACTVSQ